MKIEGDDFVRRFFQNLPPEWIPHLSDDGETTNTAGAALANAFIKTILNPDGHGNFTFEEVLFRMARFPDPLEAANLSQIIEAGLDSDRSFFVRFGKALQNKPVDFDPVDLFVILSWEKSMIRGAPPLKELTDPAISQLIEILYGQRTDESFKKRRQRLGLIRTTRGKYKRVVRIPDGFEFQG